MATETPPWAVSGAGATYTAEQTRRAMFAYAQRTGANTPGIVTGGLISPTDMQLTAPGSGLSVNVGVGEAIIGGDNGTQGSYYALNKSTTNLTIATASGSHPRVDTVVAVAVDSGYTLPSGFSGNQWTPAVITGTPTSGATLSNLTGAGVAPSDSLTLGYVLVPTSATSIITADILNLESVLTLGVSAPSYLNLGSNLGYGIRVGTATIAASSGVAGYFFNIGSTWPTLQVVALAMADTSTSGTASVLAVSATNASQISVDINSSTSQTVFVHWISIGY